MKRIRTKNIDIVVAIYYNNIIKYCFVKCC